MERYVCVHGHFYQPPRENPWLEAIELQDSAFPHHDWNERIAAECYAPNRYSRILDADGWILKIVNNYSRISFNFGPTLLSWMEEKEPLVYRGIIEADRESRDLFSGHGSAISQAYNHMILPLANRRDKHTQVRWGIRDFERRFGRRPEGMWLPETAVDLESLDLLAKEGIRFTILAPHQARRVRRKGSRERADVSEGKIDPSMPYELRLPSGRSICIFFYDGPISRSVAFEGLLDSGDRFAERILGGFSEERTWPQIVQIVTDGETYGHHQRWGEMALSYALHRIDSSGLARITNYGEFLAKTPPTHEAEIFENTSWSCAHGIERWRSGCGCNSGGRPEWKQDWRMPLREALDELRDALAGLFEEKGRKLFKNPWAARDDYIDVVLDRSPESLAQFFGKHAVRRLTGDGEFAALKLLEIQRHAMLMYTSCGWFFDEISGIESVQVLQYAGRAIQLARELTGDGIESRFLESLARAKSNIPEHRDGSLIYDKLVKPAMVDLQKVGAHYAVSSLFESYGDRTRVFCYSVEREDFRLHQSGKVRLALGRARISSEITRESGLVTFGVLHLGDHNVSGGVREYRGEEAYGTLVGDIAGIFQTADLPEILRAVDRNFGNGTYSLRFLFRDEQRRVLDMILEKPLAEAEADYRKLYEQHAPLMRFLSVLCYPLPRSFRTAAELALNSTLRHAFETGEPQLESIRQLLAEAESASVPLERASLGHTLKIALERIAERLESDPADLHLLRQLESAVELARSLPFEVTLWKTQNVYFGLLQGVFPSFRRRSVAGDAAAGEWIRLFAALGEKLSVRVGGE
jgi:alpha-amylase/alpha-mannosidase (GH57 family)